MDLVMGKVDCIVQPNWIIMNLCWLEGGTAFHCMFQNMCFLVVPLLVKESSGSRVWTCLTPPVFSLQADNKKKRFHFRGLDQHSTQPRSGCPVREGDPWVPSQPDSGCNYGNEVQGLELAPVTVRESVWQAVAWEANRWATNVPSRTLFPHSFWEGDHTPVRDIWTQAGILYVAEWF